MVKQTLRNRNVGQELTLVISSSGQLFDRGRSPLQAGTVPLPGIGRLRGVWQAAFRHCAHRQHCAVTDSCGLPASSSFRPAAALAEHGCAGNAVLACGFAAVTLTPTLHNPNPF